MFHCLIILFCVICVCKGMKLPSEARSSSVRSRDKLVKSAKAFGAAVTLSAAVAAPSQAKVYFDLDTYGDKELKIATVNRIKQKLRNAILQDNAVAPDLFKLAVSDALGYEAATDDGGPDGSIQFEMDKPGNMGLSKALKVCKDIKGELQRTNSVSLADIVAFAGGEALETVGSGRVVVQVGRVDSRTANAKGGTIQWPTQTSTDASVVGWRSAFDGAGLSAKEVALLGGALGECERVTYESVASGRPDATDPDDEEFEPMPFVPSTFGARENMYGAKMGKGDFGVQFLQAVVKGKDNSPLARALLADADVKEFVKKYASNEKAFREDVPAAYLKLTLLGQAFVTRNS